MVACALIVAAAARPARGEELVLARDGSGSPCARRAVTLCLDAADAEDAAQRADLLRRALEGAERAVAAEPDDAKAHFALFCSLGRMLETDGASVAGLVQLGRLKRAVDRALALAPGFVDAMTAKGALLVRLPGILGGDADEGERLLRHALALAPGHVHARLELAKALAGRGERQAALEEVREARVLAAKLGS